MHHVIPTVPAGEPLLAAYCRLTGQDLVTVRAEIARRKQPRWRAVPYPRVGTLRQQFALALVHRRDL